MSVIFRKFGIASTMMALITAAQSQTAAPASDRAQWDKSVPLRAYVPSTISPEAAAVFAAYKAFILAPQPAPAETPADFAKLYQVAEQRSLARSEALLKVLQPTITARVIGGVTVYEVRPKDHRDDGTLLIHVHGGGFVTGSAHSSLGAVARMAEATGKRVITVEYTVAPRGRWQSRSAISFRKCWRRSSVHRLLGICWYSARSFPNWTCPRV